MADISAPIGEQFDTTFNARTSGLVGTVAYRILDNDGNVTVAATTSGIIELGTSAEYAAKPTAPGSVGEWTVQWSKDGTFDARTVASDRLVTYDPGTTTSVSLPPIETEAEVGPCEAWVTTDELIECCGGDASDVDEDAYEEAAVIASQTLYALVPRFPGVCGPRRVRPCLSGACTASWGVPAVWTGTGWVGALSIPRPEGDTPERWRGCGCSPVDAVPLAGFVQEVLEVTLDGSIIPSDQYEVRRNRDLVRLYDDDGNPAWWPSCQDDRAAYTETGTFSVLYTYGSAPPALGVKAARELACAVLATCGEPNAATSSECQLPNGVVEVVRQGVKIKLDQFTSFAFDRTQKRWRTGMPLVDMFLNTYNPAGRRKRRPTVASPDLRRYGRPEAEVGT